jgi:8-oxo-dGTP diphosphatase
MPQPDDPVNTPVHVVAAVMRDVRGRILLARRTQGRDLAGLWEFPGGKVEPGETAHAALARELHEELGIHAVPRAPLIRVPQQYPHKRLVLDVFEVTHAGTPKGLDGQALAWALPRKLASYPMPPADRPVVAALLQADRYLVTPAPGTASASPRRAPLLARGLRAPGVTAGSLAAESASSGQPAPSAALEAPAPSAQSAESARDAAADAAWLAGLDAALAAGIRRVQLRAPAVDPARWAALAALGVARCREAGAEVLANADPALARQLGAGLHLRAAQLQDPAIVDIATDMRGSGQPLAASCHDADDLQRAQALGCDFVVLGPVQPTASHPGAPGLGWDAFARLREMASLPIYAIGGLGADDIAQARQHGAQGIAAIRGLWGG